MGLRVIQERRSHRVVRNVFAEDAGSSQLIAELVVDTVTYEFGSEKFVHREVEVESRGDAPATALKSLVDTLIKTFAPNLHPWPHDKLVTGIALQNLGPC